MEIYFNKITIIGLGLIGGSIALSLKEKNKNIQITGIGRNEANLKKAKDKNIIDQYYLNPGDGVGDSDLIILATPVKTICSMISDIAPFVKKGAVITDVGSSKSSIINYVDKIKDKNFIFVGSHPMAGSEKKGVDNAAPNLFLNSICFVTKNKQTDPYFLNKIKELWIILGAAIIEISPEDHDNIVALTSHLPHILAVALVNMVYDQNKNNQQIKLGISSGFKDTTRIASGDPDMWKDICISNKTFILKKINDLRLELFKMETLIQMEDEEGLYKKFYNAKHCRDNL
ncbi:prephenate dehydrogenase [Candidatus Desantisbacteria bacterium]|nr:prephenate dehydrogenase [Candidatus Desantisbacteria bacterium]